MPRRGGVFLTEAGLRPLKLAFMACVGLVVAVMLLAPYVISTEGAARPTLVASPTPVGGVGRFADVPVLPGGAQRAGAGAGAGSAPRDAGPTPSMFPLPNEVGAPSSPSSGRGSSGDVGGAAVAPKLRGGRSEGGEQSGGGARAAAAGDALVPWEPSTRMLPDGSHGPCGRLLTFGMPKSGIGSDVLRTIGGLALAQSMKRTFVFTRSSAFPWSEGCPSGHKGWDCFFHNVSNCEDPYYLDPSIKPEVLAKPKQYDDKGLGGDARVVHLGRPSSRWSGFVPSLKAMAHAIRAARLEQGFADLHHRYYGDKHKRVGEFRELAHALWDMRDEYKEEIESRLAPLNLGKDDEPFVVVHVRRGDKKKEAKRVALRSYIKTAQRMMGKLHGGMVTAFIMSDDYKVVTEARQALSGVRVESLVPKSASGHDSHKFRGKHKFQGMTKRESALALFTDLEAARRANVFVGTATSNMGALVQILRSQPPNTAVDATSGQPLPPLRSF